LDLQKNSGFTINHGDNNLNYVENFYKMAFRMPNQEFELDPVVVDALDKLLILHADHEQNCSTSTVRMVGSAHTGLLLLFLQVFLHFGDHFTVVQTKQ
jgi:citrate synthase